jgi:hypothetical protein
MNFFFLPLCIIIGNLDFFPFISTSDIVSLNELTVILKNIDQRDVKVSPLLLAFELYNSFEFLRIYFNTYRITTILTVETDIKSFSVSDSMSSDNNNSVWHLNVYCTVNYGEVCQWLGAGRWFSLGPPVFSTNKTDSHGITEILLKVQHLNIHYWDDCLLTIRISF